VGVDAKALVKEIQAGGGNGVEYAASVAEAVAALVRQAEAGDVILTLGAGSVSQAGAALLDGLGAKA
jgi:UDP-N-acetylmuramate--alanine ligase